MLFVACRGPSYPSYSFTAAARRAAAVLWGSRTRELQSDHQVRPSYADAVLSASRHCLGGSLQRAVTPTIDVRARTARAFACMHVGRW